MNNNDTYLSAREVRAKIIATIGTTGVGLFRKWASKDATVLQRYYFPPQKRAYFSLLQLEAALTPTTSRP
jgi:hypothetical protein